MDFVVAGCKTKAPESRCVKNWATTFAILPLLPASFALAEDFKINTGKVYKDAKISRIEADGIVVRTKTGISKIYFVELPKDVQERFHYDPAKEVAAQRERTPIKIEAKKMILPSLTRAGALSIFGWFSKIINCGGAYHHRRSVVCHS